MKTRFSVKGLTGLFLLLFMIVGCDKEKEEEPPQFETVSFDTQVVLDKLPPGLTNSDDPYAEECVDMIELALDMSSFIDNMDVPSNAQKSSKKGTEGTWQWTYNYLGEMWTFYWTYEEDNSKRYWTMEIQFGAGPRIDYVEAWETLDGKEGEIVYNFNWGTIYYGETDYYDLDLRITWQLDASDAYHYSWFWDADDPDYSFLWRYDILVNDDGSGTIDYYLTDELYYHMEWDAAGNGLWHYYMIDTSGTWTAG